MSPPRSLIDLEAACQRPALHRHLPVAQLHPSPNALILSLHRESGPADPQCPVRGFWNGVCILVFFYSWRVLCTKLVKEAISFAAATGLGPKSAVKAVDSATAASLRFLRPRLDVRVWVLHVGKLRQTAQRVQRPLERKKVESMRIRASITLDAERDTDTFRRLSSSLHSV